MTEVRHDRLWLALLAVAWFGGCRFSPQKVDLVVRNATIHTMDGRGRQGQAMAIDSGRVVAVGKEYEVLNAYRGVETLRRKRPNHLPRLDGRPQPFDWVRARARSDQRGGYRLLAGGGGFARPP